MGVRAGRSPDRLWPAAHRLERPRVLPAADAHQLDRFRRDHYHGATDLCAHFVPKSCQGPNLQPRPPNGGRGSVLPTPTTERLSMDSSNGSCPRSGIRYPGPVPAALCISMALIWGGHPVAYSTGLRPAQGVLMPASQCLGCQTKTGMVLRRVLSLAGLRTILKRSLWPHSI